VKKGRRNEGLGVWRAQDEEAKNARELCLQSPAGGPKTAREGCKPPYTCSNWVSSGRYSGIRSTLSAQNYKS
jgi:hypothetical protein